jgi:hypothetical protein
MTLVAVRLRFLALLIALLLTLVSAGPVRADIIAQWAFGGDTGETSPAKDLSLTGFKDGRSGTGWEATTADPNVTAADAFLSDSIPPSGEDYIEDPPTGPLYGFPILRVEVGSNSNSPAEAIQKDKYFQIQVTANGGTALNLSSLTFDAARGGDAPPRGWAVLSSVDGYTNIVDTQEVTTTRNTLSSFTINLSGAQYQNLSTVSFRIFVYTPGGGRSVEFHNVTINGKVQ